MLGKISHTDDAGLNNDFWHATRFTRARQSFFEKRECLICSGPNKNPAGFHPRIIPGAMNHPEERNFRLIQSTHFKKHREEKALETPLECHFSRVPDHSSCIRGHAMPHNLSLIHISEPTRLGMISYAVFCLKKKKKKKKRTEKYKQQIEKYTKKVKRLI